jgi:hypothetical protein
MRERVEPAPRAAGPRVQPLVPAFLPLQRAIGNQAVARLLSSRRQVSRDDKQKPPLPLAPPAGAPYAPPQKLTAKDREILKSAAGHRVDQAFTSFSHAVKDHAASIKAEEKFKAEILAATLDIFFGLAAPFFAQQLMAGWPGGAKLAKKLGEKLSTAGVEGVKAVSDADILKESFKAVGKAATTTIKVDASALFGETDVDVFAKQLNDLFHAGAQAITDALSKDQLTDEQLIATWAAYDVEYTTETAYTVALKQLFSEFKTFVRPIGVNHPADKLGGTSTTTTARVVWVSTPQGGHRLMLWEEHSSANAGAELESRKLSELPADIAPFAVAKTIQEFGRIETLNMPWDPPDPDSEFETVRREVEKLAALKRQLEEADRRRSKKQITDFIEQHPDWQAGSRSPP